MEAATRFLIFNYYPIIAQGIGHVIRQQFVSSTIRETSDAVELSTLIAEERFDLVIGDYKMLGPTVTHLLCQLHRQQPGAAMLFMVDPVELMHTSWLFKSGIRGLINCYETAEEITYAVSVCLKGGTYYSNAVKGLTLHMDINPDNTTVQQTTFRYTND